MSDLAHCRDFATQLRVDSIRATTKAGSGHPTSSMSAADIISVLANRYLRLSIDRVRNPGNDHLLFSKGHASPLLYSLLKGMGVVTDEELLKLRRFGSRLEGHPTPRIPFVDAATGSLGQGLAVGAGIALAAKRVSHLPYRVWVLMGDSEMAEGSVWEAFGLAAHYQLSNLIAIIDVNRLGQRGETMLGWDVDQYAQRVSGFGWQALTIDGHDLAAIDAALHSAAQATQPTCIIAKTVKGKGVSFLENKEGWHGKALDAGQAEAAIKELSPQPEQLTVTLTAPPLPPAVGSMPEATHRLPEYPLGTKIATRKAYGEALRMLGASNNRLLVLDGEVSNSTHADLFKRAFPERFFEMYIAEQAMAGIGQGLAVGGSVVFCSTFAAFWSRAHDQLRMASISQANLRICGSHAGISIGEDGASQMAIEDISLFRSLEGSHVLYPSDGIATGKLVALMTDLPGISYLRTTRGDTPVIYRPDESFPLGGSKMLRSSEHDQATIVSAGITVHEALAAADELAKTGIRVRVVDCYSVKPIDAETIQRCAEETGAIVVVEDHRPEGGLGEAVLSALGGAGQVAKHGRPLQFKHLAVTGVPESGTPHQVLESHHLTSAGLVDAVRSALEGAALHS